MNIIFFYFFKIISNVILLKYLKILKKINNVFLKIFAELRAVFLKFYLKIY
jgi:hypothetical protein